MESIKIRKPIAKDFQQCKNMLVSNDLPVEFSLQAFQYFFIAESSNHELVGIIGLDFENNIGLLRSLVVKNSSRNKGIGAQLVIKIENFALSEKVTELYLLTNTAEKYFQIKGYSKFPKEKVPDFIKKTQEFSAICPESSICMHKIIR